MDVHLGDVPPTKGGCWFCHKTGVRPMLVSYEFDCLLHEECLREALRDVNDREAQIMGRELGVHETRS